MEKQSISKEPNKKNKTVGWDDEDKWLIGSHQSKTNLTLLSYNGKTMSIYTNTNAYSNDLLTFNEENKQKKHWYKLFR